MLRKGSTPSMYPPRRVMCCLVVCALLLCGCAGEKSEPVLTSGEETVYESVDIPGSSEAEQSSSDALVLAKDRETEYRLVNLLSGSKAMQSLKSSLAGKTGATFAEDTDKGTKMICIGTPSDLADVSGVNLPESYGNYQITVSDGNVYLCVSSEEFANEAVTELKNNIEKLADKTFGVKKDMNIVKNIGGSSEPIPVFVTSGEKMPDLYDCGDNYQVIYQNVDASLAGDEIEAYKTVAEEAGYELHSENRIGENQFFTYVKGDTMVHCNYFPALGQFRIVFGAAGYLPPTEPKEAEKAVEPSISLIRMSNSLCMVYQGTDGSFVVIDGDYGTDAVKTAVLNQGTDAERVLTYKRDTKQNMEELWNFLTGHTPGGGRPQVTWMITHADPDHIGLPTVFIGRYAGQFDLNMVCYNFPNYRVIGLTGGEGPGAYASYAESFLSAVKRNYPEAAHYVYHTGDRLLLPGGEIEFLFTHEDYTPNPMPWMNHTSGVWRFNVEGTTVLITGDAEKELCSQMTACYGDDLKSDALQCNHHGSNGATLEFYQKVDPGVCFWPCHADYFYYDQRHLGIQPRYEFNAFLRQSPNVKAHYTCDRTHTLMLPSLEER